jgi:hypothetical protein
MPKAPVLKAFLFAGVMALGLASGAAEARRPLKIEVGEITTPPPPAPAIAFSTQALQDAGSFRAYTKRAEALNGGFTDGAGVEQSLAVGFSYEPQQLARGAIAYAALLALQDPAFVANVRTYAIDPTQRHQLAQRLVQDPRYVIAFQGADRAAGLIVAGLGGEMNHMIDVAHEVKQSAYSVQHSAWSKLKVGDPMGRLAQAKSASAALMSSTPDDVTLLRTAINGASDPQAAQVLAAKGLPIQGPYAPVVERGLALAALAALGEAGDENAAAVQSVETEQSGGQCLAMSKLNLYQCLAVAVPFYEDIFCLGEHALAETAQCVSKEAATPQQVQVAMGLPVAPVVLAVAPPPPPEPAKKTKVAKASKHAKHRRVASAN